MDTQDVAAKSLVCDACWNGIFSAEGWRTVLAAKQVSGRTGFSKGFSYKTTWEAVHAAAESCNWCRFVAHPKSKRGEIEVWAACDQESDCTPAGEKMLTVVIQRIPNGGLASFQQYYMYTNGDDKAARFVKARERILDVASPESYRLALECFDNCVRSHEKCPQPDATTMLPDRVIDCSDSTKPKIVLTGGKQQGAYVTLSYVWGGPQPMTTTENIDKYATEGLDMSEFPQTIQEAVEVTHKIGQRYLWIDALCILQDSDEDRTRQLGMMRSIYRNSYLTINAACGASVKEGFLRRHRPRKVPNARIPYRCPPDGRTTGSVWIAARMDTDTNDASHSYWDELEPATYRGWCLQERMLPARSLVYASDTLKYYCQTETVNIGHALCETSTGMRLPNVVYRPPPSGTEISEEDKITNRRAWLAVVFTFTLRRISVPADKLVAFAGVAEQFHHAFNDDYLAGLWRKTLLLDLLWESPGAEGPNSRPENYRAPSWSWASVDGLVMAPNLEEKLAKRDVGLRQAEILGCEVELAREDLPFGEVKSGVLKLKAPVKEVVMHGSGRTSRDILARLDSDQEPVKIGYTTLDAEEERAGELYVIPLLWDAQGAFVEGLVVLSVGEEQYRRVGHFGNSYGSKDIEWLKGLGEQEITVV